jgi:hypothetical protein
VCVFLPLEEWGVGMGTLEDVKQSSACKARLLGGGGGGGGSARLLVNSISRRTLGGGGRERESGRGGECEK